MGHVKFGIENGQDLCQTTHSHLSIKSVAAKRKSESRRTETAFVFVLLLGGIHYYVRLLICRRSEAREKQSGNWLNSSASSSHCLNKYNLCILCVPKRLHYFHRICTLLFISRIIRHCASERRHPIATHALMAIWSTKCAFNNHQKTKYVRLWLICSVRCESMVRIRMVTKWRIWGPTCTDFARKLFDIIFYFMNRLGNQRFIISPECATWQNATQYFLVTYPIRLPVIPNIRVRSLAQTDHRIWDKDVMFATHNFPDDSLELCDFGLRIWIWESLAWQGDDKFLFPHRVAIIICTHLGSHRNHTHHFVPAPRT